MECPPNPECPKCGSTDLRVFSLSVRQDETGETETQVGYHCLTCGKRFLVTYHGEVDCQIGALE